MHVVKQIIGHNLMVNHLEEMTSSIKEFVKIYYKIIYDKVRGNSYAYKALALMGLENSSFYNEISSQIGDKETIDKLCASLAGVDTNNCPQ